MCDACTYRCFLFFFLLLGQFFFFLFVLLSLLILVIFCIFQLLVLLFELKIEKVPQHG